MTRVDNLVFDAIINSLLCRMFPAPEHTAFFTDFYDDDRFPDCLLRPPAGWTPTGRSPSRRRSKGGRCAGWPRCTWPSIRPREQATTNSTTRCGRRSANCWQPGLSFSAIMAIANLMEWVSADGHLDERSPILFEIVRQIVERWPQPPDPIAGRSLSDLLRNESVQPRPQRSNRTVLRNLFRRVVDLQGTGRYPSRFPGRSQRNYDAASRTGSPVDRA